MATHYTYKGRQVDMGALLMMNEHTVALGNANMNARGDILGNGGVVIKTQEEIVSEQYQRQAKPVVNTDEDVSVVSDEMFATDATSAPKEEFDPSLLSGYDTDEAPVVEPVKPKKRKKAPAKDE